jgi:L-aspartate oxidase
LQPGLGEHRAPEVESTKSIGTDAALGALRSAAQRSLGMSRTAEGTEQALSELGEIAIALGGPRSAEEFEATNLLTVGTLIACAARLRSESRGCHSRMDYPDRDDAHWLKHSVWRRGAEPSFSPVETTAD